MRIILYKFVENQNPHFMFNKYFPENLAMCEKMCKNMVQPDCRHTLRICDKYSFSTPTMVTRKRANATLYIHSCVVLIKMSLYIPYRTFHNVLRDYKHLQQENQRTYPNGIVHSHRKTEKVFFSDN